MAGDGVLFAERANEFKYVASLRSSAPEAKRKQVLKARKPRYNFAPVIPSEARPANSCILLWRSASPNKGCVYSAHALREQFSGKIVTGLILSTSRNENLEGSRPDYRPRLNTLISPIVHQYREGKVKSREVIPVK